MTTGARTGQGHGYQEGTGTWDRDGTGKWGRERDMGPGRGPGRDQNMGQTWNKNEVKSKNTGRTQ